MTIKDKDYTEEEIVEFTKVEMVEAIMECRDYLEKLGKAQDNVGHGLIAWDDNINMRFTRLEEGMLLAHDYLLNQGHLLNAQAELLTQILNVLEKNIWTPSFEVDNS